MERDSNMVYEYVRENVKKHRDIILKAISDGLQEENRNLREQKCQIETGLIVLADEINVKRLPLNLKEVVLGSLESCTSFKTDILLNKLRGN
jgi:hypothetical protein